MKGKGSSGAQPQRDEIIAFAREQYGAEPEYPWEKLPLYCVLRHRENRKWYALIMDIPRERIDPRRKGERADILNLRVDPEEGAFLRQDEGFYPAYHMHRENWITIILDGTVSMETILPLLKESYSLTLKKAVSRKTPERGSKDWLVPANPAYYEIDRAIDEGLPGGTFIWKQSAGMLPGDTVWLYETAPVSGIICRAAVTETDIPYEHSDEHVTVRKVMRLRLTDDLRKSPVPLAFLKEHGVSVVRGQRTVPYSLKTALEKLIHE